MLMSSLRMSEIYIVLPMQDSAKVLLQLPIQRAAPCQHP